MNHMFNGIDIEQHRYVLKIHCKTYLTRIVHKHNWQETTKKIHPLPYPADNTYTKQLNTAEPPQTETDQRALSKKYNIHYRQIIGGLIWPMVKCCLYISFHITKLSQFMASPVVPHYQALRQIGSYMANTLGHGIYYWRDQPREDLPTAQLPQEYQEPYTFTIDPTTNNNLLTAYTDSDWGTCRRTRNAIRVQLKLNGWQHAM